MPPPPLSKALALSLGLVAASPVPAIGFGRVPESIVFGQTLDLSVPLRLEPGETLAPGCVRADVLLGEQRVPPGSLRVTLDAGHDGHGNVRVRSAQTVQEPVVTVEVVAGCGTAVVRRFVVFADPPSNVEPLPPVAAAADAAPRSLDGATATPGYPPQNATVAPSTTPLGETKAAARKRATPGQGATRRTVASQAAAKMPKTARASVARAAAPEGAQPRLKLDQSEALLQAASLAVARQDAALADATQAASAAQAAASAAEARLAAMESTLRDVRAESQASRAALEQMRERVARAEARNQWQPLYWALLAGLASLAGGLAWRLRRTQREAQRGWWQPAVTADAADVAPAEVALQAAPAGPDEIAAPTRAPLPRALPIEPVVERSSLLGTLADDAGRRPVTADELIDLEQQAEFFIVLGEEESAVDLLLSHLRSTGGTSPMPYLKLLEIYRRRGDQDAYERLRHRFNLRFNAYAPDWNQGLDTGRGLLDYPQVMAQLQACWSVPVDAMAELENLLFRKQAGELFDLPAYRDVLMLYAVARDLLRQSGSVTPQVDVLLPLLAGPGQEPPPATPFVTAAIPTASGFAILDEERPTSPVDLDLSAIDDPAASAPLPVVPVTATLPRDP